VVCMFKVLASILLVTQKSKLKACYFDTKRRFVQRFLSYGPDDLETGLHSLGVQSGDTLMLHSSFDSFCGFRGSLKELIDAFLRVIGSTGNLLMVSLPYSSSTYEYLQNLKCFDVRKTVSHMGLISESFRRRKGVLRSFHPTHPVLAYGPKAEWIVAEHDKCLYPCGPGSPFEKLSLLGGKVVFFNVPFTTITFFHYLEHLVQDRLTFPLYFDEVFEVPGIDWNGKKAIVKTYIFSLEAIRRRRPGVLINELEKGHLIRKTKVGNTRLMSVDANHTIACTKEMAQRGVFFYDLSLI